MLISLVDSLRKSIRTEYYVHNYSVVVNNYPILSVFHTIYAIKTEQSVYMAFSEEAPGREVDSPWQTAEQDFRAGYF